MLLPARRLHDGGNRHAAGLAQQAQHLLLLGTHLPLDNLFRFAGLRSCLGGGRGLHLGDVFGFRHFGFLSSVMTARSAATTRSPAEARRRWRGGEPIRTMDQVSASRLIKLAALRSVLTS